MEFCMAILLLERKGGLNEFTDEIVNRPDVQAMIQKVEFGVHPEAEAAGYDKMTTILEIALTDGRVIRDRADFGKGSPANPMTTTRWRISSASAPPTAAGRARRRSGWSNWCGTSIA
jgi:2-methylcitrate dehydratase PrpD